MVNIEFPILNTEVKYKGDVEFFNFDIEYSTFNIQY
jgi:hypothetical protein